MNEKKEKQFNLLLTESQHRILKKAAHKTEKTINEFIRDLVIPIAEKLVGDTNDNRNTIKH